MRRTETTILQRTPQEIKAKVARDISSGVNFNLFESNDSFSEMRQASYDSKPFVGKIEGDIIKIGGKGLKFWPNTKVTLKQINNEETELKIVYRSYFLYLIMYLFLSCAFISFFFIEENIEVSVIGVSPFFIIWILMPFYARWMQANTKKYLQKLLVSM